MDAKIGTAFVLGAGLGTRLRPLTDGRPKPLVPIFHKPLITFAFDHLLAAGVERLVVNTHHRPEAYETVLGAKDGRAVYREKPVFFRHEPILLDTAGGIKNVEDLIGGGDFLVHNGDVLADLPLGELVRHHRERENLATLILRSHGGPLQVQFQAESGLVTDIGRRLGGRSEPGFLFTGIYALSSRIFDHIPAGHVHSIIPVFLQLLQAGEKVGGLVLDDGLWFDLGTLESYHEVHRIFADGLRLSYALDQAWPQPIHPDAHIGQNVTLKGGTAVGPGAEVGDGVELFDSILWDHTKIASRSRLENCIVRENGQAAGLLRATVL